MNKEDYSLFVTIMRIAAGVLALIAFLLMFLHQLDVLNAHLNIDVVAFGSNGWKGNPLPFIGYILIGLAAIASVAMIFVKNMLGSAKVAKIVDFAVAGALVLGAILVILTRVWAGSANSVTDVWYDGAKLRAAPIVAFILALLAGGLNVVNGLLEERI